MRIKTFKTPFFDLWCFKLNKFNLCIYFYTFKHLFTYKQFDFFCKSFKGRQVIGVNIPLIYIQLITPIPLILVTEDELFDFALKILKDKANDLEDYFMDYLLGDNRELNHKIWAEKNAESQVLWQLINFYKGE